MDPKTIKDIWKAYQEVQEGKHKKESKLDPVDKDELKGKHSDRKDKDIDNDGDVDSSDEYLHNRRKAVSKAVKKDDKEQKEGKIPPQFMKKGKDDDSDDSDDKEEKGKKPEKGENPFAKKKDKKDKEEVDESSCKTRKENDDEYEDDDDDKEECPKCKGEGCDHCDGKGYHKAKKETYGKKMKESNLFTDAELEAIEEKMKQPNDSGTKAEPFMSTNSAGEKKFYADHEKGSNKDYEDWEEKGEKDAADAGKAVKSQSPKRRGENRAVDIAMPTPTKAKGQ